MRLYLARVLCIIVLGSTVQLYSMHLFGSAISKMQIIGESLQEQLPSLDRVTQEISSKASLAQAHFKKLSIPAKITLGVGLGMGGLLAYKLLRAALGKENKRNSEFEGYQPIPFKKNDTIIPVAPDEQLQITALLERIREEACKTGLQDYRFIYEYRFIREKFGKLCHDKLSKNIKDLSELTRFHYLGALGDAQGKECILLRGNAVILQIKVISCDLYINVDIQGSATVLLGSSAYDAIASRQVAYFTEKQQQEIDFLFMQIKREKSKPEHKQNYSFVTQALKGMPKPHKHWAVNAPSEEGLPINSLCNNDENLGYASLKYAINIGLQS